MDSRLPHSGMTGLGMVQGMTATPLACGELVACFAKPPYGMVAFAGVVVVLRGIRAYLGRKGFHRLC